MYWRPTQVSRLEMVLVALLALVCLLACETLLTRRKRPHQRDKMAATQLAQQACAAIKAERLQRGDPADALLDPAQTGLIGVQLSPITTNMGLLAAKQTALNTNFAAVVVDYLMRAGVRRGDAVAVGMSGSFPALNLATLAALQTLQLRPLLIVSVGSSQYGANAPDFTFLDMLQVVRARGALAPATVAVLAASRGGIEDRGLALSAAGLNLLDASVARHGTRLLQPHSLAESLQLRMQTYQNAAAGAPIRAYINVGGGATSVGTHIGKHLFAQGLTTHLRPGTPLVDSVMLRFASQGVPVVHLSNINRLAAAHGLPLAPSTLPPAGSGTVFSRAAYSLQLVLLCLASLIMAMVGFFRLNLGQRLWRAR